MMAAERSDVQFYEVLEVLDELNTQAQRIQEAAAQVKRYLISEVGEVPTEGSTDGTDE